MSILIKGMEIPELYETYKVNFAMTNDGQIVMGMCPLNETGYRPVGEVIALPDKHGRLVDADELNFSSMLDSIDQGIAEETVMEAPTIVESEGE